MSTIPAIVIDRQAKNAEPSITITKAPRMRSGFVVSDTPRMAESTSTTTTWAMASGCPAANDLPRISAERGVGVTSSFVSTPASRSQMIWMP